MNPIPLIVQEVAPEFLRGTHYIWVCNTLETQVRKFKNSCEKAMVLDIFPESLTELWTSHLELLILTCTCLKDRNDIELMYQKLLDTSMFYTESFIVIDDNILINILEEFRVFLLLAHNITEYLVLFNKTYIDPADIPGLCETIERCVNSLRRNDLYDDIKLEMFLCNVLSAYEYMQYGRAIKTNDNLQCLKELCPNNPLREILLSAFDHEGTLTKRAR